MTGHLDAERFDQATGPERDSLVAHALSCASCRALLAERDPSLLFSLLSARPVPGAVLQGLSRGVGRRLSPETPSWIDAVRLRGASRGVAAAAVLAAVLVAGTFVVRHAGRPLPAPAALAAGPPAGVSFVESHGPAHVVDMTVGETQVVMIFDPGMQL